MDSAQKETTILAAQRMLAVAANLPDLIAAAETRDITDDLDRLRAEFDSAHYKTIKLNWLPDQDEPMSYSATCTVEALVSG